MPNRLDLFTDWLSSYCIRHISLNLTLKCIIWLYNIIQIMKMIVVLQALIAVCWADVLMCRKLNLGTWLTVYWQRRTKLHGILIFDLAFPWKGKKSWHFDFWCCFCLKGFLMFLFPEKECQKSTEFYLSFNETFHRMEKLTLTKSIKL